jgi:uncharacterized protein (DUF885 family)
MPARRHSGRPGGQAARILQGSRQPRRDLGWPGQAPSYKLGERIWLQAREDARARMGAGFSLREFHSQALALGSMGLDPLREALARL